MSSEEFRADFKVRFVAGQVLALVPALSAVAVLFWALRPSWLPWIALKYLGLLALTAWMSSRRSRHRLDQMIQWADKLPGVPPANALGELLPIIIAAMMVGGWKAWISSEMRWFLVVLALAALLFVGLLLRYIVYDRWLNTSMMEMES